jgi:hypothetical protein
MEFSRDKQAQKKYEHLSQIIVEIRAEKVLEIWFLLKLFFT